jgi:hypothetical protein
MALILSHPLIYPPQSWGSVEAAGRSTISLDDAQRCPISAGLQRIHGWNVLDAVEG